jgi:hypothetical protein
MSVKSAFHLPALLTLPRPAAVIPLRPSLLGVRLGLLPCSDSSSAGARSFVLAGTGVASRAGAVTAP